MAELITSAGRDLVLEGPPATSPRRDAIKVIRATLRKQEATDDELDEALEALVELSKEP